MLPDQRHDVDELRIVVEHLLEMRHQPLIVDRVARETAADMIVDSAAPHIVHGAEGEREKLLQAGAQESAP